MLIQFLSNFFFIGTINYKIIWLYSNETPLFVLYVMSLLQSIKTPKSVHFCRLSVSLRITIHKITSKCDNRACLSPSALSYPKEGSPIFLTVAYIIIKQNHPYVDYLYQTRNSSFMQISPIYWPLALILCQLKLLIDFGKNPSLSHSLLSFHFSPPFLFSSPPHPPSPLPPFPLFLSLPPPSLLPSALFPLPSPTGWCLSPETNHDAVELDVWFFMWFTINQFHDNIPKISPFGQKLCSWQASAWSYLRHFEK